MRRLFDEGVPQELRRDLIGHECNSVLRLRWQSTKNGELLTRAERAGFEALITLDGNMAGEQNMTHRHVSVLVLRPKKQGYEPLSELAGKVLLALPELSPGEIRFVRHDDPE